MTADRSAEGDDIPLATEELGPHEGAPLPDREARSTIAAGGLITGPGIPFQPEPVDR